MQPFLFSWFIFFLLAQILLLNTNYLQWISEKETLLIFFFIWKFICMGLGSLRSFCFVVSIQLTLSRFPVLSYRLFCTFIYCSILSLVFHDCISILYCQHINAQNKMHTLLSCSYKGLVLVFVYIYGVYHQLGLGFGLSD